jgi:hypothetical protein
MGDVVKHNAYHNSLARRRPSGLKIPQTRFCCGIISIMWRGIVRAVESWFYLYVLLLIKLTECFSDTNFSGAPTFKLLIKEGGVL